MIYVSAWCQSNATYENSSTKKLFLKEPNFQEKKKSWIAEKLEQYKTKFEPKFQPGTRTFHFKI